MTKNTINLKKRIDKKNTTISQWTNKMFKLKKSS